MQEERLAELFERRHQPGVGVRFLYQGNRSAADGQPLAPQGNPHRQQWQWVLLRRYGTGGAGDHRPSDTADQRNRCRYCRPEPIPGAV